jgi:TolA-binding protein
MKEHPDDTLTVNAVLLQGLCLFKLDEHDQAVAALEKLNEEYPDHKLVPQAEFWKGFICLSDFRYKDARKFFQRVVDFYPEDSHAPTAKDYIAKINSILESEDHSSEGKDALVESR